MLIEVVRSTTDAVAFSTAWLKWEPHPGQARWLLAPERPTAVLVTGRRWGKTEVAAVQALYYAIFRPGTRQGIVSVTLDQSRIMFDYIMRFIVEQPVLLALVDKVRETPFPGVRFRHGSEIVLRTTARGGIYLRGHGFHRVIVDEADYLPEEIIQNVIRMTLADVGGQLVLISTPRAQRGLVYRELQRGLAGDPTVYAQQGSTFENPHVDHDYIQSLLGRMTESARKREIEGQYVDDDAAVFRWTDIQAAYEKADWELPEEPREGRRYVMGIDPAGEGQDWTVIVVLDATVKPYRLVAFERWQRAPFERLYATVERLARKYRVHHVLVDQTGLGAPILEELRNRLWDL